MIFPNKPFYVVSGFGLGEKGRSSSFGFSIGLDPKFAKRFYERKMSQDQLENLNKFGKKIVRNIFDYKDDSMIDVPYNFFRNENEKQTLLLQWCIVPGNACDLGIEGMEFDEVKKFRDGRMVKYTPHNVDTLQQASGLFTIWNEWVISAYALTKTDD